MSHLALQRFGLWASPLVAWAAVSGAPGTAFAEEPRKVTEPQVLRESAEVTSVVDAFDDEDKFDLHLTLGFQQTWKKGNVIRESNSTQDQFSSGNFVASNVEVAKFTETTSRLNTRAEVGLYRDLALILRLPVILSKDQELEALGSSGSNQALVLQGLPGEQLFSLPFKSPTRSGIEYLAVGLDVAPLNQQRDRTKPTWVIGIEGRFSVSEPMHACGPTQGSNVPGTQEECAHSSDINRNGVSGESDFEFAGTGGPVQTEGTNFNGGREAGVSRGTTGLLAHTMVSKRTKYVEPYGGFIALFEFQNDSSDYGQSDLQGSLVNHPPFQGTLVGGIAVFPWEVRDAFQRIELDFRAAGTYRSEGRDYSPLFDALGSSDAPSLRRPNFAQFQEGACAPGTPSGQTCSVVNSTSQKVYTTGITDVQQHGVYTFSSQFTFQAGEFVKFNLGGAFTVEQGHVATMDQPCNPDFKGEKAKAGPCRSTAGGATGIPNPNYRAVINAPGRRFRVDDATAWDAWVNATVMF